MLRGSIFSWPYYCSRYIPNYSTITYHTPTTNQNSRTVQMEWRAGAGISSIEECADQCLRSGPLQPGSEYKSCCGCIPLGFTSTGGRSWFMSPYCIWQQISIRNRAEIRQIQKEPLAIVFSCEHFHMYQFSQFEIETDHRPLEHIYGPKLPTHWSYLSTYWGMAFETPRVRLYSGIQARFEQPCRPLITSDTAVNCRHWKRHGGMRWWICLPLNRTG